ncbi:RES family NAD+ phosphorylase [Vibrio parahaemolyticus]|uniref:RES family NAD+ phosphorylase n=1 Tax=Vibrio parahaemolyticus TaxID=670 RepID=UPI00041D68EF|nr:RES family NAD+ phosphorylase [Vibrio parahaemolyticus]
MNIERLSKFNDAYNVFMTKFIVEEISECLLSIDTGIKYTLEDPTLFSPLFRAMFSHRYQSEPIRAGSYPVNERIYSRDTILFRCRPLKEEPDVYIEQDFWEPPQKYVSSGRLNSEKEQMLYLAINNSETAVLEARASLSDKFILIFYRAKADLIVGEIGWDIKSPIVKLMNKIFAKPGDGIYEVSNQIAKTIYNFDNDGWCYPSVQHEGGINFCLNLDAKPKLEVIGASMYERVEGKRYLTAVFDLKDRNDIQKLNDWHKENSLAKHTFELFQKTFKESLASNKSAHAEQPKPRLTYKIIVLGEKNANKQFKSDS